MPHLVSVIIATFNDAANLAETLGSLRMQRGIKECDVQVIISDGGSSDDTLEIIDNYADVVSITDSRPDDGVYDAMNIGAGLADGEWLHFLNAGDTFTNSDCLLTWKSAVENCESGHAWVVSGAMNMRSNKGTPVRIPSIPHSWLRHAIGLQPHCHQATWFRRDVFEAMGGYPTNRGFAGDYDLILRFGLVSRPLEVPTNLINYLGGGISEVGGAKIPQLQHIVRVDRLGLGPFAAMIDLNVAKMVGLINRTRRRVGAARIRLTAVRNPQRSSL